MSHAASWTDNDWDTLVSLAAAQAPPIDPSDVAIVLYEESGLNPASPGPSAAAAVAGLNQMSTANLESLGLSRDEWLAMGPADQLPWIFKFWEGLAHSFNEGLFPGDAGELLALNFLPGAYKNAGAGQNADAVIAGADGPYAWAYNDNPPLQNSTGTITVNTLRDYIGGVARTASAWPTISGYIQAAAARAGSSPAAPPSPGSPPSPASTAAKGGGMLLGFALVVGLVIFAARRNA